MNLSTVKWAQWDKTQSRELLGLFILCASHCAQLLHRTNLIVIPLTLQTITTAPMMSIWGKAGVPRELTLIKRDKCSNRYYDSVYAGRVHDLSQYSLAKAALGNDRVLCRERDVKTCPLAALLTLSAFRLSASAAVFITAAQRSPATPNTLRYGPPPTGRIVVKMTGHKVAPFSRGYTALTPTVKWP